MIAATLTLAMAASCPPLQLEQLGQHLRPKSETQIVFFASWCGDCRVSLSKSYPDGTLFVAAFDDPSAAAQVIARFRPGATCFTSDGIAEHYGVKALPHSIILAPNGEAVKATHLP